MFTPQVKVVCLLLTSSINLPRLRLIVVDLATGHGTNLPKKASDLDKMTHKTIDVFCMSLKTELIQAFEIWLQESVDGISIVIKESITKD